MVPFEKSSGDEVVHLEEDAVGALRSLEGADVPGVEHFDRGNTDRARVL